MKKQFARLIIYSVFAMGLAGCGWFSTKDNTPKPAPLTIFKATAQVKPLWSTSTGNGNDGKFLRLKVAYDNGLLFTTDNNGQITATNAKTGDTVWQINTNAPITAGPSANAGTVVVGTNDAHVIAVSEKNGKTLWRHNVSSVVLAAPTLYQGNVLIKTIDGKLLSLDANTGKQQWLFSQDVPALILRGASPVTANNGQVYAGFANGNLASLALDSGNATWQQPLAMPQGSNDVENMVDIDAKPIVQNGVIYAVSYQGNVVALNALTGTILWQHAFSSYADIGADTQNLYATDTKSHVWAFDQNTGAVLWHQDALAWRNTTGPVILGKAVVVGDMEGYLHFLSQKNGQFIARTKVGNAILATPLVVNHTLYVTTANGMLAAYQLVE